MKTAHALYVSNMDTTMVLLVLDPTTDDKTAIAAIAQKMHEVETYEYYQETTPEDFHEFAEAIWKHRDTIYLENRFEATYGLTLNVPIL